MESELLDHVFMYWQKIVTLYFEVDNIHLSQKAMSDQTRVVASINLKQHAKTVVYFRNADSIFSGMEAIGGFYESLLHIGIVMVAFF